MVIPTLYKTKRDKRGNIVAAVVTWEGMPEVHLRNGDKVKVVEYHEADMQHLYKGEYAYRFRAGTVFPYVIIDGAHEMCLDWFVTSLAEGVFQLVQRGSQPQTQSTIRPASPNGRETFDAARTAAQTVSRVLDRTTRRGDLANAGTRSGSARELVGVAAD